MPSHFAADHSERCDLSSTAEAEHTQWHVTEGSDGLAHAHAQMEVCRVYIRTPGTHRTCAAVPCAAPGPPGRCGRCSQLVKLQEGEGRRNRGHMPALAAPSMPQAPPRSHPVHTPRVPPLHQGQLGPVPPRRQCVCVRLGPLVPAPPSSCTSSAVPRGRVQQWENSS